jgi:sugar lactone lactonase YvrE
MPKRLGPLAISPNGDVFVADSSLNQILERHPNGTFTVAVGNGRAGFSGDGGPAVDAELSFPTAMFFSAHGTLYFADKGNGRIRAVTPQGVISTVAGDGGAAAWVSNGTSATNAALGSVADGIVGPDGALYIADETSSQVLRITMAGVLTTIAGVPTHAGIYGSGGPATAASADGPDGLAFDSTGDLYIAGSNTKTLLMVTPGGTMTLPLGTAGFYPRGDGGLVEGPDGNVIGMSELAIDRLSPRGAQTIISFESPTLFLGIHGFSPNGIAIGRDGTIYADTFYGNGYTDKSALVAISPDGQSSRILWAPSP